MKKLFLIILAVCMALFAFSACTDREGGTDETAQNTPPGYSADDGEEDTILTEKIYLTVNGNVIAVGLENNDAAKALLSLLKEGDIVYTASDYGGFEKVGELGHTLPRSDTQITTETGDVILYSGNMIVLFYGSNSWSYTRLGKMQGYTDEEIKDILTQTNQAEIIISAKNPAR